MLTPVNSKGTTSNKPNPTYPDPKMIKITPSLSKNALLIQVA